MKSLTSSANDSRERSRSALEGDSIALLLQGLQGSAGKAFGMAAVVIIGAELSVGRLVGEYVVGGHEQARGPRRERSGFLGEVWLNEKGLAASTSAIPSSCMVAGARNHRNRLA